MDKILEDLLLFALRHLLTSDVVSGAEKDFINYLRALAAKSADPFYSAVVEVIADAMGVAK